MASSHSEIDQDMEQSYDNTFASIDAAAAILQILSKPDPLDEEPEVEGIDELHLGDEVESEDQPPPRQTLPPAPNSTWLG